MRCFAGSGNKAFVGGTHTARGCFRSGCRYTEEGGKGWRWVYLSVDGLVVGRAVARIQGETRWERVPRRLDRPAAAIAGGRRRRPQHQHSSQYAAPTSGDESGLQQLARTQKAPHIYIYIYADTLKRADQPAAPNKQSQTITAPRPPTSPRPPLLRRLAPYHSRLLHSRAFRPWTAAALASDLRRRNPRVLFRPLSATE